MISYEKAIKSGKINWRFYSLASDFGSNTYKALKDNEEITNQEKFELKVILLLDYLGFPLDKLGTYFFKKIVLEVIKYIKMVPEVNDPYYNNLKEELKNKSSQFYFNLAKNDLDFGLNNFHSYVKSSIAGIDRGKLDNANFGKLCKCTKSYDEFVLIMIGCKISDSDFFKEMLESEEQICVKKIGKK